MRGITQPYKMILYPEVSVVFSTTAELSSREGGRAERARKGGRRRIEPNNDALKILSGMGKADGLGWSEKQKSLAGIDCRSGE